QRGKGRDFGGFARIGSTHSSSQQAKLDCRSPCGAHQHASVRAWEVSVGGGRGGEHREQGVGVGEGVLCIPTPLFSPCFYFSNLQNFAMSCGCLWRVLLCIAFFETECNLAHESGRGLACVLLRSFVG